MERPRLLSYTRGHETSRLLPATGTALPTGHPVAQGGHHALGDRTGRRCLREFSVPLGQRLLKAGGKRIAVAADARASPQSLPGAEEASGGSAPEGPPGSGLSNRFMDLKTCGAADPQAVLGARPSLSCLEAPDQFGMELSETRTPGPATGRRGDRTVAAGALAAYKKRRATWGPPRLP